MPAYEQRTVITFEPAHEGENCGEDRFVPAKCAKVVRYEVLFNGEWECDPSKTERIPMTVTLEEVAEQLKDQIKQIRKKADEAMSELKADLKSVKSQLTGADDGDT